MESGENKKNIPKVLIIMRGFSMDNGSGITLSNLFANWESESLLLMSHELGTPNEKLFQNKFIISSNLLLKNTNNPKNKYNLSKNYYDKNGKINITINKLKEFIRGKLGFVNVIHNIDFSKDLKNKIKEFNPDIIYGIPSDYIITKFIYKVYIEYNKKLVLHFMDDYRKEYNHYFPVWNLLYFKLLKKLVNKSAILYSICEEMSDQYLKIFKRKFEPIMNCVNMKPDRNFVSSSIPNGKQIKFFYCGNLGEVKEKALLNICKAIESINNNGLYISFDIKSPLNKKQYNLIKNFDFVNVLSFNSNSNIETLKDLKNYDYLIIPNNFDKKSIKYTRLSMSTNIPEYMLSGVPIILYGPKDIAMIKSAQKYGWGFPITSVSISELKEQLIKIIYDSDEKNNTIKNAYLYALRFHNAENIQKYFLQI